MPSYIHSVRGEDQQWWLYFHGIRQVISARIPGVPGDWPLTSWADHHLSIQTSSDPIPTSKQHKHTNSWVVGSLRLTVLPLHSVRFEQCWWQELNYDFASNIVWAIASPSYNFNSCSAVLCSCCLNLGPELFTTLKSVMKVQLILGKTIQSHDLVPRYLGF